VNAVIGEEFARRVSKQEGEEAAENARHGVNREPILTWLDEVPEGNDIVEGEWFSESARLEVAVVDGCKERLDYTLGDES
ncbi:ABC transporter permease, partial [Pseudoalteromonas phenolica]